MNNFSYCMKSIEKMGAKSDTFTATELCSCLSIGFLVQPCSYLTKNSLFSLFLFLLRCNFACREWPASMGRRLAI